MESAIRRAQFLYHLCSDPMWGATVPISQVGEQAYRSGETCSGPEQEASDPAWSNRKAWDLPRMPLRLLPGGFLKPTSPPS